MVDVDEFSCIYMYINERDQFVDALYHSFVMDTILVAISLSTPSPDVNFFPWFEMLYSGSCGERTFIIFYNYIILHINYILFQINNILALMPPGHSIIVA